MSQAKLDAQAICAIFLLSLIAPVSGFAGEPEFDNSRGDLTCLEKPAVVCGETSEHDLDNCSLFLNGPQDREVGTPEDAQVLTRVSATDVGTLVIIDEAPSQEIPALGIVLISAESERRSAPLAHSDGREVTAYEYMQAFDASAPVPERVLADHIAQRGTTTAAAVVFQDDPIVDEGSCSAWQPYFDGQVSSFGGLGVPVHLLNRTTNPATYAFHGNVAKYSRIVVGACFVSQGDGHDDISVEIERRLDSGWSTVSGTKVELNTAGNNRYIYKSASTCTNYNRRITVHGLPEGGIHAPDVFHVSGAWGGNPNGCWITSRVR